MLQNEWDRTKYSEIILVWRGAPALLVCICERKGFGAELMDGSVGFSGYTNGGASAETRPSVQQTLRTSIACAGVGVHSGRRTRVTLRPADAGAGINFRRTDCGGAVIAATAVSVIDTRLNTTIANSDDVRVGTIEHLMAALAAERIDNAVIDVDGPELPILDGSAADWVFLIGCAGRVPLRAARRVLTVLRTVRVSDGAAYAELAPTSLGGAFEMAMHIDFEASAIGAQHFETILTPTAFRRELAWARTFAMADEVAALQSAGLAQGGTLANAVVVNGDRVLNPGGLRAADEFVRHKMLDAVGDLSLCGATIEGRFTGVKSGHALNNRLLRAWLADVTAYADSAEGILAAA